MSRFDALRAYIAGVQTVNIGVAGHLSIIWIMDKVKETEEECVKRLFEFLIIEIGMKEKYAVKKVNDILGTRMVIKG